MIPSIRSRPWIYHSFDNLIGSVHWINLSATRPLLCSSSTQSWNIETFLRIIDSLSHTWPDSLLFKENKKKGETVSGIEPHPHRQKQSLTGSDMTIPLSTVLLYPNNIVLIWSTWHIFLKSELSLTIGRVVCDPVFQLIRVHYLCIIYALIQGETKEDAFDIERLSINSRISLKCSK